MVFDLKLLNTIIDRDNATLIDKYDKLNRDIFIQFICNCGNIDSKKFRYIVQSSGAFCKKCSKHNALNKTNILREVWCRMYI